MYFAALKESLSAGFGLNKLFCELQYISASSSPHFESFTACECGSQCGIFFKETYMKKL